MISRRRVETVTRPAPAQVLENWCRPGTLDSRPGTVEITLISHPSTRGPNSPFYLWLDRACESHSFMTPSIPT